MTRRWESVSAPPIAAEEIAWFELLHWVAKPASNQSSVPQHFRAVLFMVSWIDVFWNHLGKGASIVDVAADRGKKTDTHFPEVIWKFEGTHRVF